MGSVGLLYVGAVLFINGLSLLGLVKGKSLIPMDLFVGLLQIVTPLYLIFTANGNQATIVGASGLFLFGFTYLYVAMNSAFNLDGTGLGWFCLFVVMAACVYSYFNFELLTPTGYILCVLWANWAFLWLLFWIVLALGKTSLTKYTGAVCAAQGLYTGLLPALIFLNVSSFVTSTLAIVIACVAVGLDLIFYVILKPLKPTWSVAEASVPGAY